MHGAKNAVGSSCVASIFGRGAELSAPVYAHKAGACLSRKRQGECGSRRCASWRVDFDSDEVRARDYLQFDDDAERMR